MSQDMMPADDQTTFLTSSQDAIAWLEAREDYQQAKAQYRAYLEEIKPKTRAQRTEELDKLPLHELVKILDEQLPFDLVSGIADFLYQVGAFRELQDDEMDSREEGDQDTTYSEDVLIDAVDLDLLASVLPPRLASKLGRSPTYVSPNDDSTLKASILNTLSRLALSPPLTIPIARSFRPVFVDIASRWLLLLGFNGTGFEAGRASTNTLVLVLCALARTLPEFPQTYPLLILVLHHPYLQAESFLPLFPHATPLSTVEGTPSPSNTSLTANEVIHHPQLAQLLLALYTLLIAVPQLPLIRSIQENYGGPAPPSPVGEVLSSHPQLALRTLAWQVASQWLGWKGPKKEELRRKYVYDPALDTENGKDDMLKFDVPLRDPSLPRRPEECLQFWPRLPEYPTARARAAGGLTVTTEVPQMSAWSLEEHFKRFSELEWTVERATFHNPLSKDEGNSITSLPMNENDLSPLLANIAGISICKEGYIASICKPSSSKGSRDVVEQVDVSATLPSPDVFVSTSPAISALRQLAVHVSARLPVLLSSPPSAGKSVTLHHLHYLLYSSSVAGSKSQQEIVTINLADKSLDAKSLLGTLTSSPTEPGAFVFAEGSLTRAVKYGRWVVLEDVDKASDEVLSTVSELVERVRNRAQSAIGGGWGGVQSNGIGVHAGGEWVEAAENFMLFATRSVPAVAAQAQSSTSAKHHATPSFFGSQYWSEVWMDLPSHDEIQAIVEGRFPRLSKAIADTLVQTWAGIAEAANSLYSTSNTGLARSVGIRDLLKWCRRVEAALPADIIINTISTNPKFQDEVFLEAKDVFLSSLSARTVVYDGIVLALQTGLELSRERIDWALQSRVPEVISSGEKEGSHIQFGRVLLRKRKAHKQPKSSSRPYALTKPFLVLLEELAVCVQCHEPALLVGETGTGKTTAVSQLAEMLGHGLTSLNLSNQTEASDLLGGFRPINEAEEVARTALHLVNQFTDLFSASFESSRNLEYGAAVQKAFKKKRWSRLAGLFREAARLASDKLTRSTSSNSFGADGPRKKRKLHSQNLLATWQAFLMQVQRFEDYAEEAESKSSKFKFAFIEGPLVRAIRNGDWVLLDEINLATSETLESLSTLLQSSTSSLVLTERGDLEPVQRHPDFRLFACMNPANDVGKRDLPPALRSKLTEIYVQAPDTDKEVLHSVIHGYIGHVTTGDKGLISDVAESYLSLKGLAQGGKIADGSNHPPHFSMRTLARALLFAADFASEFGARRAVYEGIAMCFTTSLDASSRDAVLAVMQEKIVDRSKSPRSFFKAIMSPPTRVQDYVSVGSFWLAKGSVSPEAMDDYVLTPSVEDKLINLTRAVAAARFPILLQGPTSSGKTSIIEYLAKRSGHRFVRINNHEHTDIQEYLGTYVSDPDTGKLVFQEGLLVTAVRQGHWIVLDELNLAPSDVLEALNRLLDDNRELVVPETQEVVKPHPHFMLFATQNPPGLYGGRKVLSRAFRNRFLEMQFSDVPQDELETILCQRCKIAPSYAKKIVAVFLELQRRRQGTRLFEEKQAFVTLRDLFRWGNRGAVGYDQLALDGYMLLAERTRQEADKQTVKEVIEQIMRVSLSPESAYREVFVRLQSSDHLTTKELVWTTAMKRLYVLLRTALSFNEPVLLVGETGSGKTSICQAVARALGQKLHIVNCHQNTETSDLIGSQRPVRNKKALQEGLRVEALSYLSHRNIAVPEDTSFDALQAYFTSNIEDSVDSQGLLKRMKEADALFTWRDGPLIDAMRRGELLLLDEISLADDSVLERLNSVLEPARTLTVAEKGSDSAQDLVVRANQSFQFIGTMNPGGDFGKKELSPALRNRFTEVWVPWLSENDDILGILRARLHEANAFAEDMLVFVKWFTEQIRPREKYSFGSVVTLRDLLAWADFIVAYNGDTREGFIHGALMTLVDSLGSASSSAGFSKSTIASVRDRTISFLTQLVSRGEQDDQFQRTSGWTGTEAFEQFLNTVAARGEQLGEDWHFSLTAPTVRQNALRVLRALQVSKPVLLEGSPGVGKTSLVTALARITKHRLCRINLSDQTDLVDLFGNDAPVEGGQAGEFAWVEAPFLAALQSGDWVLLDEMNLASQSVLEGLNSCLDHRGTVYIPELDKVFVKHPDFRLFAAQNPTHQGGSRKGLPRSFVDRFTQVYMDDLNGEDYVQICHQLYPTIEEPVLRNMVNFVTSLANEVLVSTSNFQSGAPWEVNLRDLLRWLSMMHSTTGYERFPGRPVEYLDHLFLQRFRQVADRQRVLLFYEGLFGKQPLLTRPGRPVSTSTTVRIGRNIIMSRDLYLKEADISPGKEAHSPLRALEAIASSLACNQLLILTGRSGSGKSKLIQDFSTMTGRKVRTFYANAQTDTLEMLGTFEQCSQSRQQAVRFEEMQAAVDHAGADQTDVDGWHMHRRTALLLSRLRLAASSLPPDPPMIQRLLSDLQEVCEGKNGLESAFQSLSDALRSTNHPRAATAGKFEFVDGVLIQAMKAGDILVVENANRCSSAVLDRLNGLFEPGGTLFLGERGLTADGRVPEVKPHPDFRVIMTVDPSAGELSRAMRNRGVEIALLDDPRKPSSSCVSGYLTCSIINAREQAVTPSLRKHLQLPKDVLVRTHLLHTLGSQRLTSLAYWLDAIDAEPPLKALLKDVVQHLASSALSSIRPGAVTGDLPGQSHLITFFSLDTNEALKMRGTLALLDQISLDEVLANVYRICEARSRIAAIVKAALYKPLDGLTLLEQSYIHRAYPARLPSLAQGVECIQNVCEHLISTALSACKPSSLLHLRKLGSLMRDIASLLLRLEALSQAHRLNYTTYQALLAEMKKRLKAGSIPDFLQLHWLALLAAIEAAESTLKRSTGHYMEPIWAFFRRTSITLPEEVMDIESCDVTCLPKDLAQLFLDVIIAQKDHSIEPSVITELHQRISTYAERSGEKSLPASGPIMVAISELQTISSVRSKTIKETSLVAVASYAGHRSLRSLLPASFHTTKSSHMLLHTLREWLHYIVHEQQAGTLSIENLLTDSELRCALEQAAAGQLSDIPKTAQATQLAGQAQFSILASPRASRLQSLLVLALASIAETLQAAFGISHQIDLASPQVAAQSLAMILQNVSDVPVAKPLVELLADIQNTTWSAFHLENNASRLEIVSRLYLCVASWFWSLYVPDIPLDPILASQAVDSLNWTEWEETIGEAAVEGCAFDEAGGKGMCRLDYLADRLLALHANVQEGQISQPRAEAQYQEILVSLFTELRSCTNILSTSEIMQGILAGDTEATLSQLENLQASLASIHQRLEVFYATYSDIVQPIMVALGTAIVGLGVRKHFAAVKTRGSLSTSLSKAVKTLVSKPSAVLLDSLAAIDLHTSATTGEAAAVPPATELLLRLHALAAHRKITIHFPDPKQLSTICSAYEQVFALWTIDHKRAEQAREQAESIYRSRRDDFKAAEDAAREEEELLALFPTFQGLEELDGNMERTSGASTNRKTLLQYEDVDYIFRAHLLLFGHSSDQDEEEGNAKTGLESVIRNALVSVHEAAPDLVQETVDMASGQTTLHILAQAAQKSTITSPNHASDFYRDPNLRESTRLRDVVQEALERASALFSAWPEQMVLSEIVDRCKALLAVPATASVAKLLVFVESLLFKISDWEAYASRETSLQKSTERLTALVVDWRRLELQSWAGLLHTQEMAFRQPVAEWWFRLYEICVEGPRGWDKQAQRLPYIRNVLQAAQMLLDSSPAGQFADRLALMGSFARFTDCLQAYSPIYSSIATALGNLVAFYAPQASRIRAFLQAEKKKIERDVHEVIRLASWKDVNVYALKASAQKSHRQLYKRVRALRKVLETPVARFAEGEVRDERIMPEGGTDALSALHLVHEEYTVLPDDRKYEALSTLPQAIRSAEATVRRLEQVVAAQQSSLAAAASPRPLQVLADSIIQRSQELRSQVPTGSTKEERAKQAKTLTDRKRKAWSSLLSEAKRIGLSPRPSTTLVEQLSSLAVLFDAGPICSDKIIGWHARHQPIAQDIDRYFYRMCALMPNIRAAASHHHPDVASAQLQFSSGFLDSALKIIHSGRKNLQKDLHTLRLLHLHLIKLKQLAKDGIAPVQFIDIPAVVRTYHNTISILRDALQEILDYGTEHSCFMSETDISAFASVEEAIKKCSNQAIAEADRLATLDDAGRTEAPISKTSLEIFHNALETWHGIQETVSVCLSENSRFAYLLQPMLSWMMETSHSLIMNPSESVVAPAKGTTLEAFAHAMSSILVAIQELHALPYQPCVEDVDEYASGGLMLQFQQLAQRTGSLRLGDVEGQLVQFAHSMALSTTDPDEIPLATQLVTRSVPFVANFLLLAQHHIEACLVWQRALLKFAYIFGKTTLTLAQEGFCRPSETDDSSTEANNFEGTGMGSGEGTKNVSNEIENQEQVEGLQDENDQDSPADDDDTKDGKDDMLDLEDDFGGTTQDVQEQDEENKEEGSKDGDDDEEEDVDEELGKVDPLDPTAVDDKFWEDKEDSRDENRSPEPEEQSGQKAGKDDSADVGERQEQSEHTKADDGDETAAEKDEPDSKPPPDDGGAEEDGPETSAEGEEAPETEQGPRQELPEMDLDEQTLDLPDDLELDLPHEEEAEDDEIDAELQADAIDEAESADDDFVDDHHGEEDKTEQGDANMEQDAIKQEDMNEEMSHQSAAGDGSAGDTEGTALDQSTAQQEHADPAPADEPDNRVPDGDTAQRIEEPNAAEDAQAQAHSDGTDGMGQGMEGKDADKGTGTQSASKAKPSNAQKEHDASEDSDRHLGDASQSFMRRLEQIADPSDPVDRENGLPEAEMTEVPPDAEVEHVRDNNDNTGLQAMGPAAREADSKIDTEKADPDIVDDFESLGLDPLEAPVAETHQHFIPESSDQTSLDYSNSTSLSDAKAAVEQYEEADAHNKVKELSIDEEDVPAHADTVLQHWLASGRESLPAEEVWRLYSNLTRDISFSLTESLRLVLEPTLATRLKGDYRTGKRLNMRKIIPYIASDYTKDKIWLRRTRPSQREYQVLLALDDSRSMSDSKAVHLAYQTLALVCQSLTKLEVGEVSLCKFGEYTDFIHNFEDGPVTDSVGAKIVDSFSFAQRSTDVRRLLESSLQRFQSARERRGGTAADLWQLEIIVSDGMCQDLEDIRSLLRKAREQKVMVMFVVLDSLHHNGPAANGNGPSENSILSMKSVSYQRGKSGALELKMERYMDTFPFEYYVILREVESLPEILGETLRQFFDKVRGDN